MKLVAFALVALLTMGLSQVSFAAPLVEKTYEKVLPGEYFYNAHFSPDSKSFVFFSSGKGTTAGHWLDFNYPQVQSEAFSLGSLDMFSFSDDFKLAVAVEKASSGYLISTFTLDQKFNFKNRMRQTPGYEKIYGIASNGRTVISSDETLSGKHSIIFQNGFTNNIEDTYPGTWSEVKVSSVPGESKVGLNSLNKFVVRDFASRTNDYEFVPPKGYHVLNFEFCPTESKLVFTVQPNDNSSAKDAYTYIYDTITKSAVQVTDREFDGFVSFSPACKYIVYQIKNLLIDTKTLVKQKITNAEFPFVFTGDSSGVLVVDNEQLKLLDIQSGSLTKIFNDYDYRDDHFISKSAKFVVRVHPMNKLCPGQSDICYEYKYFLTSPGSGGQMLISETTDSNLKSTKVPKVVFSPDEKQVGFILSDRVVTFSIQ